MISEYRTASQRDRRDVVDDHLTKVILTLGAAQESDEVAPVDALLVEKPVVDRFRIVHPRHVLRNVFVRSIHAALCPCDEIVFLSF